MYMVMFVLLVFKLPSLLEFDLPQYLHTRSNSTHPQWAGAWIGPEGGVIMGVLADVDDPSNVWAGSWTDIWEYRDDSWQPVDMFRFTDIEGGAVNASGCPLLAVYDSIYVYDTSWHTVRGFDGIDAISEAVSDTLLLIAYRGYSPLLWVTKDGGMTWDSIANLSLLNPGFTAVSYAPGDPSIIYIANTMRQLYKSVDAGTTFTMVWQGSLESGPIMDIEVNPWDHDELFVCFEFGGPPAAMLHTGDGGTTWDTLFQYFWWAADCEFLHKDTVIVAALSPSGIFRGVRLGEGWHFTCVDDRVVAFDITLGDVIYAATGDGVWRSTDRANTWEPFNTGLKAVPLWEDAQVSQHVDDKVWLTGVLSTAIYSLYLYWWDVWTTSYITNSMMTLAVEGDGNTVYAAAIGLDPPPQFVLHTLYRSVDGGTTWTPMNAWTNPDSILIFGEIWVSPTDHNRILLVAGMFEELGPLYLSEDGGATVTMVLDRPIYPHIVGNDTVFVVSAAATDTVWVSYDGGYNWQNLTEVNSFMAMDYSPGWRALYVVGLESDSLTLYRVTLDGNKTPIMRVPYLEWSPAIDVEPHGGWAYDVIYFLYLSYGAAMITVFEDSLTPSFTLELDLMPTLLRGVSSEPPPTNILVAEMGRSLWLYWKPGVEEGGASVFPVSNTYLITDKFVIPTNSRVSRTLRIFDLIGREVYQRDGIGTWDLRSIPSGLYFYRVDGDGSTLYKGKLIKLR